MNTSKAGEGGRHLSLAACLALCTIAPLGGLAVSGIAGPGGGTVDKPVGFTWIGLSAPDSDQAWSFRFAGDRLKIKEQAADRALQKLVEYLHAAN
jgi:nicotinamide mononucleotide (NMN) deamidase PncC